MLTESATSLREGLHCLIIQKQSRENAKHDSILETKADNF